MRPISKRVHKVIKADRFYRRCARYGKDCSGRLTMEHAFIYGGSQIDDAFAIVPLCWYHHLGPGLNKRLNELIALRRATEADLAKYPRRNWRREREYLEMLVGDGCPAVPKVLRLE